MKFRDLTGQRFGSWLVLRISPTRQATKIKWECLCDCGTERIVFGCALRRGISTSCGCARRREIENALENGVKTCQACHKEKPLEEFPKSGATVSKRFAYCKECIRWQNRIRKFGIDKEAFYRMAEAHGWRCANPGCDAIHNESAHIDHCHATGLVRGILCGGCNYALGNLRESRERMFGLATYLDHYLSPSA